MLKILKDKWYLFLIVSLVGIGLLILYVYLVATQTWLFDLSGKGELGDAINGIISPVIGLIGIALLGLSFFVQYQANELLRAQNRSLSKQNEKLGDQNTYNSLLDSINILKDDIQRLYTDNPGHTPQNFFDNWGKKRNYNKEYGVRVEYSSQTYFDIGQQVWEFKNLFLIHRMHTIFNAFLFNYIEKLSNINDANSG